MIQSKFNSLWLGLTAGIIVPVISALTFFASKCSNYSLTDCIEYSLYTQVLPKILSLCVIPNLGLFFLFIWREHQLSARGVLYGTIICAAIVLGIKIFS